MKKWLFSLILVISSPFFAQEVTSSVSQENANSEMQLPIFQEDEKQDLILDASHSSFSLILELVFLLIFLAGLAYLLVFLLKKAQKAGMSEEVEAISSFRLLAQQTLGKDKVLKIIELYSQVIVLAQSSDSVRFLYEIKDEDVKNRILLDFSKEQGKKTKEKGLTFLSKWQDQFKQLTGQKAPKSPKKLAGEENESQERQDFLEISGERLKKL